VTVPLGRTEPMSAFGPGRTPYDALGGEQAVRALVNHFYDLMHSQSLYAGIRGLHQADLTHAREKLFEFLSGWLGGPPLYEQKYGHPRLRARHLPFSIADAERDQWIACMGQAMDERQITGEIRTFLNARFQHVADFMRNR
jgi:hemoglobin